MCKVKRNLWEMDAEVDKDFLNKWENCERSYENSDHNLRKYEKHLIFWGRFKKNLLLKQPLYKKIGVREKFGKMLLKGK